MSSGVAFDECQAHVVNVSEEEVSQWLYTSADTIIISVLLPIILCLGVITNFTFLFVLLRVPKMRSDTNIYLMHLALADLVFLSLAVTYDIWSYTASSVAFHVPFENSLGCIGFTLVRNTGQFASTALVTTVTFERFFATCHPTKHFNIRGKRRTYRLVAICWLVGLIFSGATVPAFALFDVFCLQWPDSDKYEGLPSVVAFCGPVLWVLYYTEPLLVIPWLFAMIANIYMYVRILQTLNKCSVTNSIRKEDHKAQQTYNKIAKMLIVNGVVFFLCHAPYRVYNLSSWICLLAGTPEPILAALGEAGYWVFIILVYINSVVNPLIYGAVNSQYRVAFIQAFRCKARPRRKGIMSKKPPK